MWKLTEEVLILTKSTKRGGYCVAGVNARSGKWIRLVSPDAWSHGALTNWHMICTDGSFCGPLDCVRVQITQEAPVQHQPENVLIDVNQKFEKLDTWNLQNALYLHPAENWETVYGDTAPFLTEETIARIDRSLILIHTDWMCIKQWPTDSGKSKTRANFRFGGQWYNNFAVTDPEYYRVADGTILTSAYLVVSLPDVPYDNGQYYKFIARIFAP